MVEDHHRHSHHKRAHGHGHVHGHTAAAGSDSAGEANPAGDAADAPMPHTDGPVLLQEPDAVALAQRSIMTKFGPMAPLDALRLAVQQDPSQEHLQLLLGEQEKREEKKRAKREANRRSAHSSRARRKAYVEAVNRTNTQLRTLASILASLPDMVIALDTYGRIVYASPSVATYLKFSPSALVGLPVTCLCTPATRLPLEMLGNPHPKVNEASSAMAIANACSDGNGTSPPDCKPDVIDGVSTSSSSLASVDEGGSTSTYTTSSQSSSGNSGDDTSQGCKGGEKRRRLEHVQAGGENSSSDDGTSKVGRAHIHSNADSAKRPRLEPGAASVNHGHIVNGHTDSRKRESDRSGSPTSSNSLNSLSSSDQGQSGANLCKQAFEVERAPLREDEHVVCLYVGAGETLWCTLRENPIQSFAVEEVFAQHVAESLPCDLHESSNGGQDEAVEEDGEGNDWGGSLVIILRPRHPGPSVNPADLSPKLRIASLDHTKKSKESKRSRQAAANDLMHTENSREHQRTRVVIPKPSSEPQAVAHPRSVPNGAMNGVGIGNGYEYGPHPHVPSSYPQHHPVLVVRPDSLASSYYDPVMFQSSVPVPMEYMDTVRGIYAHPHPQIRAHTHTHPTSAVAMEPQLNGLPLANYMHVSHLHMSHHSAPGSHGFRQFNPTPASNGHTHAHTHPYTRPS